MKSKRVSHISELLCDSKCYRVQCIRWEFGGIQDSFRNEEHSTVGEDEIGHNLSDRVQGVA